MKNNILNETFQKHLSLLQEKLKITSPTKKEPFLSGFDKDVGHLSKERQSIARNKLLDLYNKPLSSFVPGLKTLINDDDVKLFLKYAKVDGDLNDDNINVSSKQLINVNSLTATQSEVFLDKSIKWPMQNDPTQIKNFILTGIPPESMSPIVISGEYIIDGHHRWSQVYCWNKDAKVPSINIAFNKHEENEPEKLLKKIHIGIASSTGQVPLEDKGGTYNLFDVDPNKLTSYLVSALSYFPKAYEVFKDPQVIEKMKSTINESKIDKKQSQMTFLNKDDQSNLNSIIVPYIYANVLSLQKKKGIFPRSVMPQTEKLEKLDKLISYLKSGDINFDIH